MGQEDTRADSGAREASIAVIRRLQSQGHEALWAGGCVRDLVMKRVPKDYDVATSAVPEEVDALFDRTVLVGAAFGVVRVLLDGHEIEVATFRTDQGYSDGRRPDAVEWASAREDVLRRDFTINGLLADPCQESGPRIIDHVGGQDDIHRGLLKAIGDPDARFAEDKLRLLRAIRFAARLGFEIETATWTAIGRHRNDLHVVSMERIRDELTGMLTEGEPERAVTLLMKAELWSVLVPEAGEPDRVLARLRDAGPLEPVAGWSLALLGLTSPETEVPVWGGRLKMSRAVTRAVTSTIEIAQAVNRWPDLGVATRKRLLRRDESAVALKIATQAVNAGQGETDALKTAREDAARWSDTDLCPPPLLTGDDLRALGHSPGPAFAKALRALEDAQLEGRCTSRPQAEALVATVLESGGPS